MISIGIAEESGFAARSISTTGVGHRRVQRVDRQGGRTRPPSGIDAWSPGKEGRGTVTGRYSVQVRGVVQGVGFRPFVHGLAGRLGLTGSVRNSASDVLIDVEGDDRSLGRFFRRLSTDSPPLSRIDEIRREATTPRRDGVGTFVIEASERGGGDAMEFPPDVATCMDCLAELFDPDDRRHLHPFINCTSCGPRWTVIEAAPYDRASTTMARFAMCSACRAEYDDPRDRRFHAQPNCCPGCGPRLRWEGEGAGSGDPLDDAVAAFLAGRIGAVKGVGGYHLACDARARSAVEELRRRKMRDEKPMAILVADLDAASLWCEVSSDEAALLASPGRPIVLLRRRRDDDLAYGVAAGAPTLGVMLPYTPLHHLLIRGMGGSPLVLTSGNLADEPIAFDDEDARRRLTGIADFILSHDRPIAVRCDDSVSRIVAGGEVLLRRSRGHVPGSVRLPHDCPVPILALGGQQKAVFALAKGRRAVLSHHLGGLDDFASYRSFEAAVGHFERLFEIEPELMVRDLHPDYASNLYADRRGLPTLAVQHHHAHVASCMAENGLDGPVLGVAFDGSGLGPDGAIWGGEFLESTYEGFRRAAHLRYVPMPGGSRAIREPWRMALAHLEDAGEGPGLISSRVELEERGIVAAMLERRINSPLTSSAGRLFDAVAALAGLRQRVRHEGQAAMELEWASAELTVDDFYPFEVVGDSPLTIDTRPLISAVASDVRRDVEPGRIGRRFHTTMVEMIAEVCGRIRANRGLEVVALSGGVFMNSLLLDETIGRLEREGFVVHRHRRVPPNDGGLCLGQLAIAATTRAKGGGDVPGDTR
ncbi:carbamoyltransferase HypF [Paludisphaera mucosa]|uniref:Carbamoyltransferase n=1 Tax=Paludisphaera mucosa TaxID=3030827 RepID=A0ABT6FCX8_9BACT|nr:carbamoyltransferase HypF [Paludisphaera mucosa]